MTDLRAKNFLRYAAPAIGIILLVEAVQIEAARTSTLPTLSIARGPHAIQTTVGYWVGTPGITLVEWIGYTGIVLILGTIAIGLKRSIRWNEIAQQLPVLNSFSQPRKYSDIEFATDRSPPQDVAQSIARPEASEVMRSLEPDVTLGASLTSSRPSEHQIYAPKDSITGPDESGDRASIEEDSDQEDEPTSPQERLELQLHFTHRRATEIADGFSSINDGNAQTMDFQIEKKSAVEQPIIHDGIQVGRETSGDSVNALRTEFQHEGPGHPSRISEDFVATERQSERLRKSLSNVTER